MFSLMVAIFGTYTMAEHVFASENNSLPIRISSQILSECSAQEPIFDIQQLKPRLISALNEKYGSPLCRCSPSGTWKQVIHLNPNITGQCPSTWEYSDSIGGCGRSNPNPTCDSATFPTEGFRYNRVCGKLIAIQRGANDAFANHYASNDGLEEIYLDGVSLTHGAAGSRQHIWSFVAALYENDPNYYPSANCQCTNVNETWPRQVPSFVGNQYFCATPNPGPGFDDNRVYTEDPLWDGEGCGPTNACCQFNQPPWFCTTLPETTTDDLELRICSNEPEVYESIFITFAEMYVSLS